MPFFFLLSILIYSTQGMVYFFFTCNVILIYVHSNNDVKTPAAILRPRTTRITLDGVLIGKIMFKIKKFFKPF